MEKLQTKNTITIMGCGSAQGVPSPYGGYGRCNAHNPKNTRTRMSAYLTLDTDKFLIDAGPDLRQHMLSHFLLDIKAVFFTHVHADHCHGIDDLRNVCAYQQKPLPIYGAKEMIQSLEKKFDYAFPLKDQRHFYRPCLQACYVDKEFVINQHQFYMFEQDHGFSLSYGFKYHNMAYSTDVTHIPPQSDSYLYNLDLWLIDCYGMKPHPTHSDFQKTLAWIKKYNPKKAVLIHMNNQCDYDMIKNQCPDNVEPAYDGMTLSF